MFNFERPSNQEVFASCPICGWRPRKQRLYFFGGWLEVCSACYRQAQNQGFFIDIKAQRFYFGAPERRKKWIIAQ